VPPERKPAATDVVCRRELTRRVGGRECAVTLTVLRPVPEGGDFACELRIEGLGSRLDSADELPSVVTARGVDAMQALLIAFEAMQSALRPFRDELAWLGMQGEHGIPLIVPFVPGESAEFHAKIEAVVDREMERFSERYLKKQERRARRAT
jgi:hypothetical protein